MRLQKRSGIGGGSAFVTMALMLCLLVSALLPLTQTRSVSAQSDPIVATTDTAQVDDVVVQTDDVVVQDLPLAEATPTGDEPADAPSASLLITKFVCPVGYDASGSDFSTLEANCSTLVDGVQFIVHDGNGGDTALNTGAIDPTGKASIDPLPGGITSIAETIPDGYDAPRAFCETSFGGGYVEEQVTDGSLGFEVTDGDEISCVWFNIPTPDGGFPVKVTKYVCPEGFDSETADASAYIYGCTLPLNGVTFDLSMDGGAPIAGVTGTQQSGVVEWDGVTGTTASISEEIPAGYGAPAVFCDVLYGYNDGPPSPESPVSPVIDGGIELTLDPVAEGADYLDQVLCSWYNVPVQGGTISIDKHLCPIGFDAESASEADLQTTCAADLDGIIFDLYGDGGFTKKQATGEVKSSAVVWDELIAGTYTVSEELPSGYANPVVYCEMFGTSPLPARFKADLIDGNAISGDFDEGATLTCDWYNVPLNDGSITIIKHTCAPGYDLLAQGANPAVDCPELTNGIVFDLQGISLTGEAATGDNGPGTVRFSGLWPQPYRVSEKVPEGIAQVFVLSCDGHNAPAIQPYPLALDDNVGIELGAGEQIVCQWYDVSAQARGSLTIQKFACSTETFVSVDDCEVYEDGADFSLSVWTAANWVEAGTGTTDAAGILRWYDMDDGMYTIDETSGTWCFASSNDADSDGNIFVTAGHDSEIDVYNCGLENKPKKPTKFPTTGVDPNAVKGSVRRDAPVTATISGPVLDFRQWAGVFDGRLIEAFADAGRPERLTIDAVGIDANIEAIETVNGEMQDPTTASQAAWYKDSAKLGTDGNVVIAGHLNYWGVPEGVFFHLEDVQTGDHIVVTSETGIETDYVVDTVQNVDVRGADIASIVGPTTGPRLTLITCGGAWDTTAGEYNQRTVVSAAQITDDAATSNHSDSPAIEPTTR